PHHTRRHRSLPPVQLSADRHAHLPDAVAALLEVAVHHADGHRAFAHRHRHPFDRTAPHIADGKYARAARLEERRWAAQTGPCADRARGYVVAGEDEAVVIHRHAP